MVHNALEAVRGLAMPSSSANLDDASRECIEFVRRAQFADLLEIINDRLGLALENEAGRMTH